MKYQVIKKHRSEYPNPIVISKGDKLIIGEKSDEHEAWNDWYFCEVLGQTPVRVKGWVPKQAMRWLNAHEGEALENYSAQEMDVDEGEVLMGEKLLNGWIWCKNLASQEEGWVPAENLVLV